MSSNKSKQVANSDINSVIMGDTAFEHLTRRRLIAKMLIDGKPYSYIEAELQCSSALVADVSKKLKDHGVKF